MSSNVKEYLSERVKRYSEEMLISSPSNEFYLGRIGFLTLLLRVIQDESTARDVGFAFMMNDMLQDLGIINFQQTFYLPDTKITLDNKVDIKEGYKSARCIL